MTDAETKDTDHKLTDAEIKALIQGKLAVSQALSFRALGIGKRLGKAAVASGEIPTTPAGTVPTPWLRAVLMLTEAA
jgi:hypothetical protein